MSSFNWVDPTWLAEAIGQAKKGLSEGGLPIGSVLVDPSTGQVSLASNHKCLSTRFRGTYSTDLNSGFAILASITRDKAMFM